MKTKRMKRTFMMMIVMAIRMTIAMIRVTIVIAEVISEQSHNFAKYI